MIGMANDKQQKAIASLTENPIVQLAGHILMGGALSVGGYLGGDFIGMTAQALKYVPLADIGGLGAAGLGYVVAGVAFAGYVGYQLLYGQ